jgi:hypothetical protein
MSFRLESRPRTILGWASARVVFAGLLAAGCAPPAPVTQTTTVLILLALTSSRWRITAGCRYPGSEPCGSANSTHQTCPRRIAGISPCAE